MGYMGMDRKCLATFLQPTSMASSFEIWRYSLREYIIHVFFFRSVEQSYFLQTHDASTVYFTTRYFTYSYRLLSVLVDLDVFFISRLRLNFLFYFETAIGKKCHICRAVKDWGYEDNVDSLMKQMMFQRSCKISLVFYFYLYRYNICAAGKPCFRS